MRQAGDEVVVNAFQCIDRKRDSVDPVQHVVAEDRIIFDRHCDNDVVRSAEGIPDFIVQLNIGVILG